MIEDRIINEIKHGKFIAKTGEHIWNWSSPAGKIRWQRRSNMFIDFLGNDRKKILEIGCGTGLFTKEIAKTDNEITSIDISEELITLAKEKVQSKNVTFLVENAYKTSFQDNYFDFIVGSSILHHLDIDEAIKEFYRLLKDNGKIMFTEPNMLNPQIALQKNIPFLKKLAGDSPDETAFFKWSIDKKITKWGFCNPEVYPFDFLHPAIPGFMLSLAIPVSYFCEKIPLLKEIAGSLVIKAAKSINHE
jgi:2-polyprenyl-3-methyl-5-hydroxy-6-metoxy-1,4-benzoquinol methylase